MLRRLLWSSPGWNGSQNSRICPRFRPRGLSTSSEPPSPINCRVCDELSRGVCGSYFDEWCECADKHPDSYVENCRSFFQAFEECLEASDEESTLMGGDNEWPENNRRAWIEFMEECVTCIPTRILKPNVSARILEADASGPRRLVVEALVTGNVPALDHLLMFYVQDDRGELLLASSRRDILSCTENALVLPLPPVARSKLTIGLVLEPQEEDSLSETGENDLLHYQFTV